MESAVKPIVTSLIVVLLAAAHVAGAEATAEIELGDRVIGKSLAMRSRPTFAGWLRRREQRRTRANSSGQQDDTKSLTGRKDRRIRGTPSAEKFDDHRTHC